MDLHYILKILSSLGFVCITMFLVLFLFKKYTHIINNSKILYKGEQKLSVKSTLYIDTNNKLIIVNNKDDVNYLLAVNKDKITLLNKY